MGLWDAITARTKPTPPNLDQLFALPAAAISLDAATGFTPTGVGSVCFKAAEGAAFDGLAEQVGDLLALEDGRYERHEDEYGFSWLIRHGQPDDLESLVADLHLVNTTLVDAGFGAALLCTVIVCAKEERRLALVYLYKRGTWYPFVPVEKDRRDNTAELQVRSALEDSLLLEKDLSRWFPVYGAPGL